MTSHTLPDWARKVEPIDMNGAAHVLGVGRRFLVDAIKRHPHYERRGSKKVFYPEHIEKLRVLIGPARPTHESALRDFIASRIPRESLQVLDEWLKRQDGSWIYIVRCHERVKIGFTDNWGNRLRVLKTACPYPLNIIALINGSRSLEFLLHRSFSDLREHGEWFREEGDLRDLVAVLEKVGASHGSA